MMQSLFSKDMMKKVFCQGYLWLLLLLLYSPIFIIIIFSFTEAKVMGNWTGFSLQLTRISLPKVHTIRSQRHWSIP